jgi:hypothetical protein
MKRSVLNLTYLGAIALGAFLPAFGYAAPAMQKAKTNANIARKLPAKQPTKITPPSSLKLM